jgi:hypothetical protein
MATPQADKLYDLADRLQSVVRMIEFNEGELTPELELALDEVEGDFEAKAQRVGFALWNAQRALDEEQQVFELVKARRDKAKRLADGLSRYLGTQLHKADRSVEAQVSGVPCTWSAKEKTETIVPEEYYQDPSSLPGAVYAPMTGYMIDRREVRKLLNKGVELPKGIHIRRTYTAKVT